VDGLEQQLRSTLADSRLDLPLRPDATNLVHSGVRRRRRNRAIATVASVVVLLGGGVAATSLVSSGGGNERIVPPTGGGQPTGKPALPPPTQEEMAWTATAYDYHHPPAFPGAEADPTVPWCRASQLTLSQFFQGATGSWAGSVTVTNNSTNACALQGQPVVAMQTVSGQSLLSSHSEPFFVDAWVRLAPERSASAGVTWFPEFCHEPRVASIRILLPHSGGSLTTAMRGGPRCDVDTGVPTPGHLDVDGFVAHPGESFTPLAGLQAQLDKVPSTALPGSVLDYRLQLQSMDASSVALDPCLPYRARLVSHATGVVLHEEDYLLNCGTPPLSITTPQSMHSTYFDLKLNVPSAAPPGDYDLVWQSVLKPVNATSEETVRIQAGPPPCRDGQITATDGHGHLQAMNQYGHTIVLRNISNTTCSLLGYPGLTLVDGAGRPIGKDAGRGGGYVFPDPGPHLVVLTALAGTASFTFGGPAITNAGQTPCPTSAAAVVYPPGLRHELKVGLTEPYCSGGISVTAVTAGSRGTHY